MIATTSMQHFSMCRTLRSTVHFHSSGCPHDSTACVQSAKQSHAHFTRGEASTSAG